MATNAVRLIVPLLLGALMLLFPSDGLRALGLGEARVDSWLGQPLDVSIRLLAAEDENVESLSVRPAELTDFERLGVPSESLGLGLEVTVDRSVEPARVRVRSRQAVNDPVVQILIDARWSSGRVLREYTLFLDPPTVDSAPPVRRVEGEQAAQAEPSEPSEPSEPATREETPARTQPVESARTPSQPTEQAAQSTQPEAGQPEREAAPDRAADDAVTVAPGDTLWRIATEWRQDSSLSMDQVMLAIFNRNRNAFLGENINRLRSDARLDMPVLDDVRSVDRTEAERRVRDHMDAWQAGSPMETPQVSEAAMRELEPPRETETAPASGEEEAAHRLDVVPLEDEPSDEGAAVSDGEIRRVRGELTRVEDEILAEGLERQEFDDRVAEIRDALDQSDLAGLAVAEESLAELQQRLREVREAEAAQAEALAEAGDEETGRGDRVADYMRELEGEFAGDASASNASDETPVGAEEVGAQTTEAQAQTTEAQVQNEETPVEEPAEDNLPGWLIPAAGLLLLALILAAVVFWLLRRRTANRGSQAAEPKAGAVKTARSRVDRHPSDLAAHLALLQVLADRGHTEEFTDAFDQMYQQVDDETDPNWQEALSLAAVHAPDHPLLMPQETSIEDDHERRTDEMLGMLEADSEQAAGEDEAAGEGAASTEEVFDLSGGNEEEEAELDRLSSEAADADEHDEAALGEDLDLAVLSERVDDHSEADPEDRTFDHDDELDFGGYAEQDEDASDRQPASSPSETSDDSTVELPDEAAPESDLDLGSARDQEADEIVGEAGTREEEDFDPEFTSDLEHEAGLDTGGGLDFEFEETPETPEATAEDESDVAQAEADAEAEAESETIGPEASDDEPSSLSDEDADVKLDLARAYISVDLGDSARSVLEEVISDGSTEKRAEAQQLLDELE